MTEPADLIDAKDVGMDASLLSKVDEYLQRDIDAGLNYGSSLLVARHGKVVHRAILGVAEPGRPLAPSDVFMQMSMSKAYTAVLVLRAIEAGRFELDTRVADLIPAFAAHGKDRATIRQLLNHTAGLPSAPVAPSASIATAGHLAAYAGIAPVTRRSGTSIRGEFPARSGNKQLKNALFRSAWVASCHDPVSKAYYDKKRAEGKKHNAAVICLARRRLNVMFALVRDGSFYQAAPDKVPQAA